MNAVAAMVDRVRQQNGKVLVEEKAAAHACRLEAADSQPATRRLLANLVRFAAHLTSLHPEEDGAYGGSEWKYPVAALQVWWLAG
jgi:hypothetical protein